VAWRETTEQAKRQIMGERKSKNLSSFSQGFASSKLFYIFFCALRTFACKRNIEIFMEILLLEFLHVYTTRPKVTNERKIICFFPRFLLFFYHPNHLHEGRHIKFMKNSFRVNDGEEEVKIQLKIPLKNSIKLSP
jgi:hypothetical protein